MVIRCGSCHKLVDNTLNNGEILTFPHHCGLITKSPKDTQTELLEKIEKHLRDEPEGTEANYVGRPSDLRVEETLKKIEGHLRMSEKHLGKLANVGIVAYDPRP